MPVDALRRIAEAIGAVLPEAFARAGALAAVDAEDHRRGNALGLDKQRRQGARSALGAVGRTEGQRRWALSAQPIVLLSRSMTLSMVWPSARAVKFKRHAVLEDRTE